MALQFSLLQDAPENTESAPLMEFLQWMRQYGETGFLIRYQNYDFGADILDLGDIRQGIEEWQDPDFGGLEAGIPPPPDIRAYLDQRIAAGQSLVWVTW